MSGLPELAREFEAGVVTAGEVGEGLGAQGFRITPSATPVRRIPLTPALSPQRGRGRKLPLTPAPLPACGERGVRRLFPLSASALVWNPLTLALSA